MAKDYQPTPSHQPDYYAILALSTRKNDPTLTPPEIKAAYKRSLLQHHPDKKTQQKPPSTSPSPPITVDSIALAYKILSSPALKASYDAALQTSSHRDDDADADKVFRTGLDSVDLDDLVFDEGGGEVWTRACRCGDERGFVVGEAELEANAEDGELITGCRGCSLWLRVLFGVEEEG
ncbi:hypothetical protein Q7P37_002843 [Cladosporium fusiforme]